MNKWTMDEVPEQQSRLAIVTGANNGIGCQTTIALVKIKFEVVMACRNMEKAEDAKNKILQLFPGAKIHVMMLDLSSIADVKAFAEKFKNHFGKLDLLINNAGIMMPPYKLSPDGFESQLATNYIGHFALTGLLLSLLTGTTGSRIVNLSSLAFKWSTINFDDLHFRKGYSKRKAYGQSKRACLIFAFELQRRLTLANAKSISVAAHPGLSKTNLDQYFPSLIRPLGSLFLQSAQMGALPVLYAALSNDINGGEFIGPDGFQQMRGYPNKVYADEYSHNEDVGNRLWEESQKMTGVYFLEDGGSTKQNPFKNPLDI